MEKYDYKGYQIKIEQDCDAENPREWDNVGTIICFHGRYNLGDKHNLISSQFNGWNELHEYIVEILKAAIILPLFLYDHSGLRIKVGSFQGLLPQGHAEFDSGQVGFIYVTEKKARIEWGNEWKEKSEAYLAGEVKDYDTYLRGDVWGYVITKDEENIDSCWGHYGYKYCKGEAELIVDDIIKQELKDNGEQLELNFKGEA